MYIHIPTQPQCCRDSFSHSPWYTGTCKTIIISMNCHISQEISPGNKYMYIIHVIREVLNHRICSKFVTHIEFSMETCMHHWSPDINPSYEYFLAVHKINPEPDLWEKTLAVDWIINRQPVYRCHKLRQ